jgi:hypothetical protein
VAWDNVYLKENKKKKNLSLSLVPFTQRHTKMAKWIAEAEQESDDDEEREDVMDD